MLLLPINNEKKRDVAALPPHLTEIDQRRVHPVQRQILSTVPGISVFLLKTNQPVIFQVKQVI